MKSHFVGSRTRGVQTNNIVQGYEYVERNEV